MEDKKLIIHNYTDLNDAEVLLFIINVINEGLVSETSKGKQYCFVTKFKNNYVVTCDKIKTGYSFKVVKEN